jgi:hypothetical protein
MKFLKIFSAILFFSFFGSFQNQLFAQAEPTKNIGSSAQKLNADEYLEHGNFRAKLAPTKKPDWGVTDIVIYRANDNTVVNRKALHGNSNWENHKSIGFDTSNESEIWFTLTYDATWQGPGGTKKMDNLSDAEACMAGGWSVLNSQVKPTKSVYFQLESDGKLSIYSGTGGTKIMEFKF